MNPNPELDRIRAILHRELPRLREQYHVASLALFGSVVRGEHRPDSDVDILVTYERVPGFFKYIGLELHLTELLGRKVDLVHQPDLKPRICGRVLNEMVSL